MGGKREATRDTKQPVGEVEGSYEARARHLGRPLIGMDNLTSYFALALEPR